MRKDQLDRADQNIMWVEFKNTTFVSSGLLSCLAAVDNLFWDSEKVVLDEERELYNIGMWSVVLWYEQEDVWEQDKRLFQDISDTIEISKKLQVPTFSGEFKKDWKFYLIVTAQLNQEWETNDYLYKWMVVNPKKYIAETIWGELNN